MYRFLLTPRWLGYAALTVAMAAVMVLLGFWQLDRYHERSAGNARLDATARAEPRALGDVLRPPSGNAEQPSGDNARSSGEAARVGPAPSAGDVWARVVVTGRYDPAHEILVRGRTVADQVGFEVVTPLVLDDGSAVLVDRGWIAPGDGGAGATPQVPPAPGGQVRVTGRVHAPESRAGAVAPHGGRLEARRIAPRRAAAVVPYPLYGGYVVLQSQVPAADGRFVEVVPPHENALQNAGYVLQWWLFAAITVMGYGFVARREARDGTDRDGTDRGGDRLDDRLDDTDRDGTNRSGDRLDDSDRDGDARDGNARDGARIADGPYFSL